MPQMAHGSMAIVTLPTVYPVRMMRWRQLSYTTKRNYLDDLQVNLAQ